MKYASFDDRGVVQVERLPTRPALVKLPRRAFVTLLVSSGTDAAAQASLRTYTDAALTVLHTLSKKNLALLEQQHQAATATHAANTFDEPSSSAKPLGRVEPVLAVTREVPEWVRREAELLGIRVVVFSTMRATNTGEARCDKPLWVCLHAFRHVRIFLDFSGQF